MRATRAGSIQAVVQRAYDANGGIENSAVDMQVSPATASYGLSLDEARPGGLGLRHVEHLVRARPECAVPFAEHYAIHAGGVFMPLVGDGPTAADLATVMREFSNVLALDAQAHSEESDDPHDYTPKEALGALKKTDELLGALTQFRAVLLAKSEARS
ncbi:MAG: hypothetical protein ACSHX3_15850 [Litorimonas sp.]